MITHVKICGITNWADAKLAIDSGADALGFNFYKRSPRRVSYSCAKEIISKLPERITTVGVFVNAAEKEVVQIAHGANLSLLQLHGDESPNAAERLARACPVIKAFQVGPQFRAHQMGRYKSAAGFLLDGFNPVMYGGTGELFDWRVVNIAKQYGPIILAGGLRADNIAEALRKVRPFAVDICSGVEARPGKKDPRKIKAIMMEIERASEGVIGR